MTTISGVLSGLSQNAGGLEGIGALTQGAAQLESANQTLQDGYSKLAQADTDKMVQGANKLAESGKTITAGLAALQGENNKNAQALLDGAKKLQDAKSSVTSGLSQISEATGQLQSGVGTLAANTGVLESGASQLSSRSGELTGGASELAEGTGTLAQGASELKSGTSSLVSGTKELSEGTSKLSDGSVQLKDGIKELKDGAVELKDGQEKFHEEGIQKLNDTLNEKFRDLLDRFEAISSTDAQYTTFTDKKSGMDGNVKFIYETDPIEFTDGEE